MVANTSNEYRLGTRLLKAKHISERSLHEALALQEKRGGLLGDILKGLGAVSPKELSQTLADQHALKYVDLIAAPPEESLLSDAELNEYIAHGFLPWRYENGRLYCAVMKYTLEVRKYITERFGENTAIVFTSQRDICWTIEHMFAEKLDEAARLTLLKRFPEYSAHRKEGDWLSIAAILFFLCAVVLSPLSAAWLSTVLVVANVFFFFSLLLKLLLFRIGMNETAHLAAFPEVPEQQLPIYTVLVPLYKEAESVPGLLKALARLDYPKERLDIKLIVESDDVTTLAALKDARPASNCEILRAPYSLPRTKPKACNYALRFARGEFVTIYDAEDRPDPDQLKKAVAQFRHTSEEVVCLQARLNYYNRPETWLTKLFSIEYACLFNFLIPGLYRTGIPIPLGGTSNHIALDRLRDIGEWDPFNVTEDADLGLRLAAHGYHTEPLDLLTLEEAPLHVKGWLKQRSRWVKGYFQTWLVHMRNPAGLKQHCGRIGFWGVQFFIGGSSLLYLLAPFMWIIALSWLLAPQWLAYDRLPDGLMEISLAVLTAGIVIQWYTALVTVKRQAWRNMDASVLVFPLYWALHSIASLRSIWQLIFAPYHWDKTSHGLSQSNRKRLQ
jgi:cellulose synthase/poly-beta-1,6-N-acetylglucosamine synthase-like glycosyltransferase